MPPVGGRWREVAADGHTHHYVLPGAIHNFCG